MTSAITAPMTNRFMRSGYACSLWLRDARCSDSIVVFATPSDYAPGSLAVSFRGAPDFVLAQPGTNVETQYRKAAFLVLTPEEVAEIIVLLQRAIAHQYASKP